MLKRIIIITDYKGFFSSKQFSKIYRGGLDLSLLKKYFYESGYKVEIINYAQLQFKSYQIKKEKPFILYQSSEDKNSFYKSFIEDVIYDLEKSGVKTVPKYEYLKAHNNKVSMELLRLRSGIEEIQSIQSKAFGSLEEIVDQKEKFNYPLVIKKAAGAMSRGVALVRNSGELLRIAKKISSSFSLKHDIKEVLRKIKYGKRYIRESFYRDKFVVQNLIDSLDNDWKVLVYGDKIFALYRGVREGDFRASGSGKFIFKKKLPEGMLDYAWKVREKFNVPHISLDIAFDGNKFHLIEFQFIMFGTTTIEKAPHFWHKKGQEWFFIPEKAILEKCYSESVIQWIERNNKLCS